MEGGENVIGERIKLIRKQLDVTQQEFSDKLGIARNNIAGYETNKRSPSDAVVSLICTKYNINESWLRTGEGGDENMFIKLQKNDLVSKAAVLLGEKDPGFEALVETYSKLSPTNRKVLLDFWTDFAKNVEKFTPHN